MNIVNFIESQCVLPARSGPLYKKPYQLMDWQKKFFSTMFYDNGKVKIPNAYLIGARKTGKTDAAMLALAYRFFDPKRSGELHTVSAFSEGQAKILYEYFIELISLNASFKKVSKIYQNKVVHKNNNNQLKVLTKSLRSAYGLFGNGINIFDELGIFDDECFARAELLIKGSVLAPEPQTFYLANIPSHSEHKSLDLLLAAEKSKKWQVKKFVGDKKYKWSSPKCWASSNPFYSYKKTPQVKKFYREQYAEAQHSSKSESEFKRLLLGWGNTLDNSRWIDPENLVWADEKKEEKIFNDQNISWSVGYDLSLQGSDSTSWSAVGIDQLAEDSDPLDDEKQKVYIYSKIYYGNIKNKRPSLREKIITWNRQGFVSYQGSEHIQQAAILDDVYEFLENKWFKEDVEFIFDPAFSQPWIQACEGDYVCKTTTYSPKFMTRPIRVMQRKAEQKNIIMLGGRNAAIVWQCGNGIVNELSRNWCLLSRLNKNKQLNIDCWSASLLGLSHILEPKTEEEGFAL